MNENENNGTAAVVPAVENKKPVGRPRSNEIRREIWLETDTKLPRRRGKPTNGKSYLVVSVQRSITNDEFVYGQTPTFGERVATINRPVKQTKVVVNQTSPAPVVETPVAPVVENPALVAA